jgi:hypothetical protein
MTVKVAAPPLLGKVAPNLAYEYTENEAAIAPIRKARGIWVPACALAVPKRENSPAPIIPPIPRAVAEKRLIFLLSTWDFLRS